MSETLWYIFGYACMFAFTATFLREPDGDDRDLKFAVVMGLLWPLIPAGIVGMHAGAWARSHGFDVRVQEETNV